ncbi:hypothetical protein MVEG_01914 [Podila verticillata NRRL 6337]|nr:MAG: hypothetical protein BYD32DRAFT_425108 [Podila humilis]KFH71617.1 hypothetical protein MVEG_01914 [Podila verticillata NRRL 6337]
MSLRGRQLFIGNLPFSVGWQELKDLFRGAGVVQRAHIQNRDGRSKGHGLVLFESIEDATKAQEMFNGYLWQGRALEVREDRSIVDYAARKTTSSQREDVSALADDLGKNLTIACDPVADTDNTSIEQAGTTEGAESGKDSEQGVSTEIPVFNTKTIHVGNIPFRVRWQDLKDLFRKAGHVVRADVAMTPDNRSRGFGTVVFSNEEEAKKAIGIFDQYLWQDRALNVQEDKSNFEHGHKGDSRGFLSLQEGFHHGNNYGPPFFRGPPMNQGFAGRQVFVGNIPFQCQWQDLKDLFRKAGHIVRADVAIGTEGRSRGFGSVLFTTQEDAQTAITMFDNYDFNGRILRVHYDRYAPMGHGPPLHGNMGPMMHPHPSHPPHPHHLHGHQHPHLPHPHPHPHPHPRLHPIHAQHAHGFPGNFHQPPMMPLGNHPMIHGSAPMQGQFGMGPPPLGPPPQFGGRPFSPTVLGPAINNGSEYPPSETTQNGGSEYTGLSSPPPKFESTSVNSLGSSSPKISAAGSAIAASPSNQPVLKSQPESPSTQQYPFQVGLGPIGKPNASHSHLNLSGPAHDHLSSTPVSLASSALPISGPSGTSSDEFVPRSLNTIQPYPFGIGVEGTMGHDLNGHDESNMFSPPFYIYPNLPQKPYQQPVGYPHYDQFPPQDSLHLSRPHSGPLGSVSQGRYPSQPEWIGHSNMFPVVPPHHMYSVQPFEPYNHEKEVVKKDGEFSEK